MLPRPVDGEASRLGLLLEHDDQRRAAPVGSLHEQRDVEVAKAVAEPLLQARDALVATTGRSYKTTPHRAGAAGGRDPP